MTSQPQPAPGESRPVGQYLRPLRDLAAWALVLCAAVLLFVAFVRLIPAGDGEQFVSRTQDSFYSFVNPATIFFPLAAVLLSLLVRPEHPKAKVITVIALVEYGVAAFFGVVFGILVGLIQIGRFSVRTAFEELLVRAAWLAVFALAAVAVHRIWRGLFHVPRPVPQPGVYGQPQYGVPGTYPGQPGYGPVPNPYGTQPAQPGSAQPGFAQPGQPGFAEPGQPGFAQPGQAGFAQPGQPGFAQPSQPMFGQPGQPQPGQPQPGQQAAWGQPGYGPPAAPQGAQWGQPVSAQPAPGQPPSAFGRPDAPAPVSAQPGPGTPPGPYAPGQAPPTHGSHPATPPSDASSEPTQAVPRHDPTMIDHRGSHPGDQRPGFGPADQDPPRR